MKIRKELAQTRRELLTEISNNLEDHSCDQNYEEGMSCTICCLTTMRKPLALLQYLRSKGKFTYKMLSAESKLWDLLGEKRLKEKIKEEVEIIRNIPKKKCFNCGKIIAIWMPYSSAALLVHANDGKKIQVNCTYCSERNYFSSDELKYKYHKKDNRNLVYAIGLAGRFGYTDNEDYDNDHSDDDDDDLNE